MDPDGVLLSNGPGDPEDVPAVVETGAHACRARYPIFGICLGHQMIALAYGARTYKLKFGHRGGNHPVQEPRTRASIEMTSQNHSYAVDAASLAGHRPRPSPTSTCWTTRSRASECRGDQVFSVQYHPESAPGPQDSALPVRPVHRHAWKGE